MATPVDLNISGWTRQNRSPFYRGLYWNVVFVIANKLGTNIGGLVDFNTANPLVNIAKMSRPWIPHLSGVTFDTGEALDLDSDGYVQSIPTGADPETYRSVLMFWAAHESLGGDWVFTYDGEGTIVGNSMTVTSQVPGRIEFTITPTAPNDNNFWFEIQAVTQGNHPRNFKVVRPADESNTATYTSEYIDSLKIFQTIRFMDWGNTNNNTITTWSERYTLNSAQWTGGGGVPYETMFDLCNQLNADCWICIPHLVDDNYVTQLATLALSQLNSDLGVYVEYSNEIWNGIFNQGTYAETQGVAEYASGAPYTDRIVWHGKRTKEVGNLWKSVWSGSNSSRVTVVLGAQASNPWTINTALDCATDSASPCYDSIDAVAIAPYFGTDIGQAQYESTVELWDSDALYSELRTGVLSGANLEQAYQWIDSCKARADLYGKELIAYEGGQHLGGLGTAQENQTITDLFTSFNRSPEMGQLFSEYLDTWDSMGGGLFANFAHIGQYTKFGSWGSYEGAGDRLTPKRIALECRAASYDEPSPLTSSRTYMFGNSLLNHATGAFTEYTNVPRWMQDFADSDGTSYAMGGQFGFGATHVSSLPPDLNWGWGAVNGLGGSSVLDSANWAAANIDAVLFTPANFRQEFPATDSDVNWDDITTETTNTLFSFAENSNPGNAEYYIYQSWRDMSATFTTADFSTTYPTTQELANYWNDNNTTWHQWWLDYQDAMTSTYPSLNVKMMPVGYILGILLTTTLVDIPAVDLYEDSAPHGRATLYFLAALIVYMSTYRKKFPFDYIVPANVNSLVADNFPTIINQIWTELLNFKDGQGNSRVFTY